MKFTVKLVAAAVCVCVLGGGFSQGGMVASAATSAAKSAEYVSNRDRKKLADKIGVAHADGKYSLTDKPYLLEGAEAVKTLGSNVIKVSLSPEKYPYNNADKAWSATKGEAERKTPNLADVLKLDYYDKLFRMGFNTYVLQAQADTADSHYWADGLSKSDWTKKLQSYKDNYYNAAKYLLQKYGGEDKEFYFEQWEVDLYYFECMKGKSTAPEKVKEAQNRLLEYLAARHEGIKKARDEFPKARAKVFSAVELIWISSEADFKLIDRLNEVKADYISYSLGSDCGNDAELLVENLDLLKQKLGGRPFYIGEIQVAENVDGSEGQKQFVLAHINAALDKGAKFALIWQIYSNEADRDFWLIRKDKTKTPLYTALKNMLPLDKIPGKVVPTQGE